MMLFKKQNTEGRIEMLDLNMEEPKRFQRSKDTLTLEIVE